MKPIPEAYRLPCETPGAVTRLDYRDKYVLLYTPARPADRVLYLIHGGGGDQHAFFCPAFLNMADRLIAEGRMAPVYMVSPCFYDPAETDKTPASSGRAVAKFPRELREEIIPLAEKAAGRTFTRDRRAIGGFSMGGVTTWYALLQAADLFGLYIPMSGDCWVMGEKGGGDRPAETAAALAEAWEKQGAPEIRVHAVTGTKDIAFPNLDPQIRAMQALPAFADRLVYETLEGGVHDYETIFRYLYNILPAEYPPEGN
ncbi:MAG: hypothetical protein IKP10_04635 [Clostridia bacterium]|nr:hypothetical protein [Clostridia bacterium]